MIPVVMQSRDDWHLVVEAVQARVGKQPLWKCLAGYYNVCIASIITFESLVLRQMYMRSGRGCNETWQSYLDMPAAVAEAFELLDAEFNTLERIKEKEDQRRLAVEIGRARSKQKYGRR